jgi:hypothetical protein
MLFLMQLLKKFEKAYSSLELFCDILCVLRV